MDRDTWKNLSGKSQWDVTVALRGPDVKRSEVIKSFTTSVIRSNMSGIIRVGGQLSDYGFVLLPNGSVFKAPKQDPTLPVTFLRPDMDHFLGHVSEAANILGIPIVYVDPPAWEAIMLEPSPQHGMIKFLKHIAGHESDYVQWNVLDKIHELQQTYGIGGSTGPVPPVPAGPTPAAVPYDSSNWAVNTSTPVSSPIKTKTWTAKIPTPPTTMGKKEWKSLKEELAKKSQSVSFDFETKGMFDE